MSVHVSSSVWKSNLPNPGQKLVLLALADMTNAEGYCWPSVGTLAKMTNLSDSSIRSHIKTMKEAGYLEVHARAAAGGRQTSNFFRILVQLLPPPGEAPNFGTSPNLAGEAPNLGGGRLQISAPLNRKEEPSKESQKEEGASSASPDLFSTITKPEESKLEAPETLPDFPAATMVRIWNECVPEAKISALAGQRKTHARARWKQIGGTVEAWEAFCQRVGQSPFLTGKEQSRSKRTFTASFDWAILPGNFLKIQEGKYAPKPESKAKSEKHEW